MKAGIGASVARIEDRRLLTGLGRYTADIDLPAQAHAVVVRSPVAHGRIVSMDTGVASEMPGVLAVLTGADVAEAGLGPSPCMTAMVARLTRSDGTPMVVPHRAALARDKVVFVGDPVALVVAETRAQAQEAAEAVLVEYDELPAVTDVAAAAAAGTPAIWDGAPDNECFTVSVGDKAKVDALFATAAHVVAAEVPVTRVIAAPMEPRAVVAHYDRNDDRYTVWTGTQSPHRTRRFLAETVLKVPETKLRIVAPDMGGAFGMRSTIYPEMMLLPWVSKRIGRPVKWVADRSESFLADDHGRDSRYRIELALDTDGLFLAARVSNISAMGGYLSVVGPMPAFGFLGGVAGVYRTRAIHATARGIFTNAPPTAAYRGAGRPEAILAIETVIDRAAAHLGIDRIELRRRNLIPPEAMPFRTGLTYTYDSGRFEEAMDKALAVADVAGFGSRRAESEARGKLRGLGVINAIEAAGGIMTEGADLRFDAGGTVTLAVGTHSHGQGHETAYRQILSDRLGLDLDRIAFVQGDTDRVPLGGGTFGSRSLMMGGGAIAKASDLVIEKGRRIAAFRLETSVDDLEFSEGVFRVAGTDRAMTLDQVAQVAFLPGGTPPDMEAGLGAFASYDSPVPTFPNGCHVAEVEIDPETGDLEILRYVVVDDVGTVLNPVLLKGQIHGGVAQGIGQALLEEIRFDPDNGQMVNGSFMDYGMPRADDLPDIEVVSSPVPTANNPLGVKGAGEAGTVGALPCLLSAIDDALSTVGGGGFSMPATPERLWRAIRDATGGIARS